MTSSIAKSGAAELRQHRRLDRLHRQILAGGADARPGRCAQGAFTHREGRYDRPLPDRLSRVKPTVLAPGATASSTTRLFAGAKEVSLLDELSRQARHPAVRARGRFRLFWFLTEPLFFVLDFFYQLVGNFGVAILLLTIWCACSCSRSRTSPSGR